MWETGWKKRILNLAKCVTRGRHTNVPREVNEDGEYGASPSPTPFHENLIQNISLVTEVRPRKREPVGNDRQHRYTENVYCQLRCRVEQENFLADVHKKNYAEFSNRRGFSDRQFGSGPRGSFTAKWRPLPSHTGFRTLSWHLITDSAFISLLSIISHYNKHALIISLTIHWTQGMFYWLPVSIKVIVWLEFRNWKLQCVSKNYPLPVFFVITGTR